MLVLSLRYRELLPLRYRELLLDHTSIQILRDRVARQPSALADLADRLLFSQRHPANDVSKSHVDHSVAPAAHGVGVKVHNRT